MSDFRVTGPGRYELRNREVVEVELGDPSWDYPVREISANADRCWTMEGHYLAHRGEPSDLVRRLDDGPTATSTAAPPALLERFAAWGATRNPSLTLRGDQWRLEYTVEDSLTMLCSGPSLEAVLRYAMEEE